MSVGHEEFLFRIVTAQKKKKKKERASIDLKHVEDRQERTWVPRGGGGRKTTRAGVTLGGGGGETTRVHVNERGGRPQRVHIFEVCRLFFSLREGDYIDSRQNCWMSRLNFGVWKPNLGTLERPGCHNHSVSLLYHVRTYYIVHYNSPTNHSSQPTYTINELPKKRKKRNKGG